MDESHLTIRGWVGGDVDVRQVGEGQLATFRVGSTPRYLKDGQWVDRPTSWYTVNCWRTLGGNVARSVRRGDAVVVEGRVRVDVWEREGQPNVTTWIIEAVTVGHDLTRGTAAFTKTPKQQPEAA